MTSPEQTLDPSAIFAQNPLTLYRLTHRNSATLAGKGSASFPGRWNRLGEQALYTSTEMAATVLERLVHTDKKVIPANLVILTIEINAMWSRFGTTLTDRESSGQLVACRSLAEAGKRFASRAIASPRSQPFAIALPSVVLPVWNVVLYPAETGFFEHVSIKNIEPFEFDPRLFPEDVRVEIH